MTARFDEATYFSRRTELDSKIGTAQHDFDEASLAAATANEPFDVATERATLTNLEAQREALGRAYVRSQELEAATAKADREADRLGEINRLKDLAEEVEASAEALDGAFDELIEKVTAYVKASTSFQSQLAEVTMGSPYQRRTLDINNHNMIGPCIIGKLRKANLANLDDYDPVQAMRAFERTTPGGIATERLRSALRSASQDILELRPEPLAEAAE